MKIKYIFFDFDGVLAESVNIKTEAFREMYLIYGNEFAQKVVDHHLANGGVSRYEKFRIYNGEWLGEDLTLEREKELASQFSKLVLEGVVNSAEVEGTSQFLESNSQYIKYIITGTPTIEIKPILREREMDHFFEEVYGSPEKKEYWVEEIIKKERISPEECVFVGDALADYKAALSNEVHFVLRETEEAASLFKNYQGFSIKNLKGLPQVLQTIELQLTEDKLEIKL